MGISYLIQYGQTALLLACLGGRTDVVTTLLSAPGVLVNSAANTVGALQHIRFCVINLVHGDAGARLQYS